MSDATIGRSRRPSSEAGCPLCAAIDGGAGVLHDDHAVAIPDAYPLSPGHHLVVPWRHEPDFFALRPEELAAILRLAFDLRQQLQERWQPDGFNLGVNVGTAAGQTIGHVHLHLIPRYHGDTPDPRGGIRWILPDRAPYWDPEVRDRPPAPPQANDETAG